MILSATPLATASDLLRLTKPRVTLLVVTTTAVGIFLSPTLPPVSLISWMLLGTFLMVGSANTLNMYLERDLDARMRRTSLRPLPAARLTPRLALGFGLILSGLAITLLAWKANRLTALLGFLALLCYVLLYTPLKPKSHAALLVGAIPGAIPPLMGWTAATNSIAPPGVILFLILFLWQVPHFLAIALFREEEYREAGIKVFPIERGIEATKQCLVRYQIALFAVTLYPILFWMANASYLWISILSGSAFLIFGIYGLKGTAGPKWAKTVFVASLIYLPLLLATLVLSKTN